MKDSCACGVRIEGRIGPSDRTKANVRIVRDREVLLRAGRLGQIRKFQKFSFLFSSIAAACLQPWYFCNTKPQTFTTPSARAGFDRGNRGDGMKYQSSDDGQETAAVSSFEFRKGSAALRTAGLLRTLSSGVDGPALIGHTN